MAAPYRRTREQMAGDFADAKAFEQEVAASLGVHVVDRSASNDELDFWVPGFMLETKERKQPIGDRWLKHAPGVDPTDLFIVDELSVRRALKHWPEAYFLLRDRVAGNRLFLASITELCVVPRTRVMRAGKAKLLFDMTHFRQITSLEEIAGFIRADLVALPWKSSGALGAKETVQV